jgi:tripartite-type tricarboxylate transporter receptor subunit TctC
MSRSQDGGGPRDKKKLDTLGFVPVCNSPAEFSERIKSEAAHWDKVVMVAGIQVD